MSPRERAGATLPAIDQSGMRRLNTSATLRVFAASPGPLTSAELVAETRLSRRTIELIVADLVAAGWVAEIDPPTPSGAGRPKKYYELIPSRAIVLSVVILPPAIRVLVADVRGRELAYRTIEIDPATPADAVISRALSIADEALLDTGVPASHLVATSVGISGTISQEGVVLTSPNAVDWVGFDIRTPFAERFGRRILVENDTNLAALAARHEHVTVDTDTFVLLIPGVRVAAGVVIDGHLHRGFDGAAGELVRLPGAHDQADASIAGGISSPTAVEQEAARALLRAASRGDEAAHSAARPFLRATGRLIALLGWVLAPPVVILAASFEGVEDDMHALMRAELDRLDLPNLEVRVSVLDARTPLRGGVWSALDSADTDVFGGPFSAP